MKDVRLINEAAYSSAAAEGVKAIGDVEHSIDHEALALRVRERVKPFADAAAIRVADEFADKVDTLLQHPDLATEVDAFWKAVDEHLASLNSDVVRYAEPPWNAGYVGYGESLAHFDVLMDWVAEDDDGTCDDCAAWDEGSPYDADSIPSWPGQGDSQCLDRCRCTIQAEQDSWNNAFGGGE